MEESRKQLINRTINVLSVLAIIIYVLRRFLHIPDPVVITALSLWGITIIYHLTQWKENKKSDNFFNLFILALLIFVIFTGGW